MLAGAKFCRRCGAPSKAFDRSSVTEAETRVFQATDDRSSQTRNQDPRPTGPSYIAPNESAFPNQPATTALEQTRVKRHGLLWGSAIVIVLLFLLGCVLALKWVRSATTRATSTTIEAPPEPGTAPPIIPQPPQPPAVEQDADAALIYPGAQVTMAMTRGGEGSVRTLRTKDSAEKVIAWYTEKLKPEKVIKTGGAAVLTGTKASAVISNEDGETNVVLKIGIDR